MTLEEIDASLPNGFHDAEIKSIIADYTKRRLTIDLSVWLGGKDNPGAHRLAEVIVEDLWFLVMDTSDTTNHLEDQCPTMDHAVDSGAWTIPALQQLPKGVFVSRFFVSDWNSCMYIAARTATLAWKGEVYERRPDS